LPDTVLGTGNSAVAKQRKKVFLIELLLRRSSPSKQRVKIIHRTINNMKKIKRNSGMA